MKTINFQVLLLWFSIFSIAFSSCSEDSASLPQNPGNGGNGDGNTVVNPNEKYDILSDIIYDDLVYVEKGNLESKEIESFYISQYEVTQFFWEYVMKFSGKTASGGYLNSLSNYPLSYAPLSPSGFQKDYPAYYMNFNDINNYFLPRLKEITGIEFYLPTVDEWEYAAKGGNKSKGYVYAGSNNINEVAWYRNNSNNNLHAVGQKKNNELGIYDMSGNVYEWCRNWPENETVIYGRMIYRGGAYGDDASHCVTSTSITSTVDAPINSNGAGFRIVMYNFNVTAEANDINYGKVTINGGNNAQLVKKGDKINLMATPSTGYKFSNWSINGEVVGSSNPLTITVNNNLTIIANFTEDL